MNVLTQISLASLSAEEKVEALKVMGFSQFYERHQPDCPHQYDHGLRCNCLPPGTSWGPPKDVKELLGETYEQLRAKAAQ